MMPTAIVSLYWLGERNKTNSAK